MQFDVVKHRMAAEFNTEILMDRLDFGIARLTDAESAPILARQRGVEVFTRSLDGALLALFTDEWRMRGVMRDHPDLVLNALLADTRG